MMIFCDDAITIQRVLKIERKNKGNDGKETKFISKWKISANRDGRNTAAKAGHEHA